MRFTVSQSALERAVAVVGKGVAAQAPLPILTGVRIEARAGSIEFQSTDLNISVRHQIPANVEDEGATVVPGKVLFNVVKNLPDAAVTFEDDGSQVVVRCEKSRYRLNTWQVEGFPEFSQPENERQVELPSDLLSQMVDKVYKVTSKDTSRPILAGVLLTVENNVIRLVATDSYRLAVCDTAHETSGVEEAFEVIVPGGAFHDVLSMPDMAERVTIGVSASQVVFSYGSTTYITRRIEGNYPNYRQLLPPTCTTTIKIDAAELSQALRRVAVIAATNTSVRLDADADGALIKLSSSSPDQGEASETMAAEIDGASASIAFNYHYVTDCVRSVTADKDVQLELTDAMHPGVFKSFAKINYLYLLMPVRM